MFLHIGKYEIIPLDSIVSILNARFHLNKKNNSWMLTNIPQNHDMKYPQIKSIIIMDNGEVYYSHIASETLKKRIILTMNSESMGRGKLKICKKSTHR